jgi:FkbM family methyltransferase
MKVRPHTDDLRIVKSNLLKKSYTKHFIPFAEKSIVVDVGAHIGSFSIMVARRVHKVLAFEPEPSNYRMLKKNMELNRLENMRIFEMAVSGHSGYQDIYTYPSGSSADYSLYKSGMMKVQAGAIPVISIEDIIKREDLPRIDFLKLDCEGAEHDILRYMHVETAAKIMEIAMERHSVPPDVSIDLPARLNELGFEVKIDQNSGYLHARRTHPR